MDEWVLICGDDVVVGGSGMRGHVLAGKLLRLVKE